ncbi:MAG: TrkH family potassium uptake protein, partial [Magnetococcales bacterium]|nr:TrkH family potassium uptake protein [Magnetococcales bacterium]
MNYRMDIRLLSVLSGMLGLFELIPWVVSWRLGEDTRPFTMAIAVALCGGMGYFLTNGASQKLTARDGILVVGFGWFLATVLGGMPFVFGGHMGWIDSWFETSSGLTTTGASIVPDVEIWPKGQLFWRALTQWLGGMGILVLAIAFTPFMEGGVFELMKAEVPGPSKDRFVPRVARTAQILWLLYLGITIANILAFHFSGMDWLESFDHAFTTMATGGYSTRNASMAAFSPAAQWWCVFFMAVAGGNFLLHYRLLVRGDWRIFQDTELRLYLSIIVLSSIPIGLILMSHQGVDLETGMRHAFFSVVSIMTTTGYANDDFELWPYYHQMILLCLMVIGGMAGSTAGGIKVVRLVMVWQLFLAILDRLMFPRRITLPKYAGTSISPEVMEG